MTTLLLVTAILASSALIGYVALGRFGLFLAVSISLVLLGASAGIPAWLWLRLQGGLPLSSWEAPRLHRIVRRLSARAEIPMPNLYWLPRSEPNALALGGGGTDAALAVTEGLVRHLNQTELEAVLAHEIGHLRNGDTTLRQLTGAVARTAIISLRLGTLLSVVALLFGSPGALGRVFALSLLGLVAPLVLRLLDAALLRTREFAADAAAAELTGDPLALASALSTLERSQRSWLDLLFGGPREAPALQSHPPTADRVRRLHALASSKRLSAARQHRPERSLRPPAAIPPASFVAPPCLRGSSLRLS